MLVACHRVTDKKYNGSKKEESSKEETSIVFFVFLNRSASWRNDFKSPQLYADFCILSEHQIWHCLRVATLVVTSNEV